jgi:predicted XRE-type DNA-binding protein
MPKLSDRKDDQRFFGMFVGRHHSGKTVAEASFPKPIDFEDFDGRIGGAQVPWLDQTGITYTYWPPKSPNLIQKLNEKLDNLLAISQMQNSQAAAGLQLPKTHVTDSVTNQCYAFICQAIALTHMKEDDSGSGKRRKAGRWIGPVQMAGIEDYGLESQGMSDYVAFLKSLPIQNVILSAHLIDQYGFAKDEDGDELPYAPRIIVGQKLSIRDKIGETIQTHFDHIFKFERETSNKEDKFYVTFRGGIACTSYDWLPYGRQEWTKKPFYEFMMAFKEKKTK